MTQNETASNYMEKTIISFPAKVSIVMILVAVSELVAKTERFYYPIFVVLLLLYFVQTKKCLLRMNYSIFIIFFSLYSLMSVIWSPVEGAINGAFIKLVVLVFLGLQLQFEYSEEDYKAIKNAFLIQGIVFSLVFFAFGVRDWDGRVWIRNGSLSTDPNSIAVWTIIPLCCAFEALFNKREKLVKKAISATIVGLMIYIILQGASRSGIISIAITSILCIAYGFKDSIRKKPIVALLIVVFAIAAGVYVLQHIPASVIARFQYTDLSSFGGRTTKWTTLIDMLEANPLKMVFGFGESTVIYYIGTVAHNMYVEVFFAQGLVGIGLLIAFMIGCFRNSIKNDAYIVCSFIGVAIMSASLSEFTSRGVMFAMFFAGISVHRAGKNCFQEDRTDG